MTTRDRSRSFLVGAAIAALLAPLALVAAFASPASAGQMKQHEVYMYKVEKHVDLYGEFPDQDMHEHVSCNPGDIALEGMWRVDNVDQANPPETMGDERDVVFLASYGDDLDRTEWHFRATNFADGKAQIKLWVTCIRGNVEPAHLHTHHVQVTGRGGWHNALGHGDRHIVRPNECPVGTYAVTPGFNVTSATHGKRLRIFRSWPTSNYRGWQWSFRVTDPVDVTVYLRCFNPKTGAAGNGPHAHEIPVAWRPDGHAGHLDHLNVHGTQERRVNCDDGHDGRFYQNYKAMVGGFWIHDPDYIWFLGMDPRPKQRAFKYWWDGVGDSSVYHGALCIRARTGKQIRP